MKSFDDEIKPPFSVVLLAGGTGSRMASRMPKQYLLLQNKPIILHSLAVFLAMPEVKEICVVCEKQYECLFSELPNSSKLCFARPGIRRQDSLLSGLQQLTTELDSLICIHDAARPFIQMDLIRKVVKTANQVNAAALGVPVKSTIKMCDQTQTVRQTLDRKTLWEVQTPQVIRLNLLLEGIKHAQAENLSVTDDLSLIELLGVEVKIVESSYANIKITTPEDMIFSQELVKQNGLL